MVRSFEGNNYVKAQLGIESGTIKPSYEALNNDRIQERENEVRAAMQAAAIELKED